MVPFPEPADLDRIGAWVERWASLLPADLPTGDSNRRAMLRRELFAYACCRLANRHPEGRIHGRLPGLGGTDGLAFKAIEAGGRIGEAASMGGLPFEWRQRFEITEAMLDRFCRLTGMERGGFSGPAEQVASLALYVVVFSILTAEVEVTEYEMQGLLRRLRACREALESFPAHGGQAPNPQLHGSPSRLRRSRAPELRLQLG